MVKLIRTEFKKFSNSYINYISFGAMLFPVIFTSLIYYFTDSFAFTWYAYVNSLHLFYGIFIGALIPSFIAIFSVFYEFSEGTIKNILTSPYSRTQIIVSKILYVFLFVIGLYIAAGVLVLLSGMLIGLETTFSDVIGVFKRVTITGMTTVVLVPMMIYITLLCRNFVLPVVVTFLGTAVGIPLINLGQSYFYPWMIPSHFFFRMSSSDPMDFSMPVITFVSFTTLFFVLSIIRFKKMDFSD